MWNNVIGQERVKQVLISAIEHERIPSAYLFYGPEGVGKDAAAIELAKAINCLTPKNNGTEACDECASCVQIDDLTSPSLHFVFALAKDVETPGSGANVKEDELEIIRDQITRKANDPYHNIEIPRAHAIQIGQVRELRLQLTRSVAGSKKRVVIISEADMMNQQAQNAFLKTLEEPNPNTLLILTSSNSTRLYPTILSRCQEIRFDLLSSEEIAQALTTRNNIPKEQAEFLSRLAGGSYSYALSLTGEDVKQMRNEIVSFLRMGLSRSRRSALKEIDAFVPRTSGSFLEKRTAVEQRLQLLALWLRDALALTSEARQEIINQDQLDALERFVSRFGEPARIIEALKAVERAQGLARAQVQLRPLMIDLIMELENALLV